MEKAFVILAHSGHGAAHYDFMLDLKGPALATWRLAAAPSEWRVGEALPARKLPDHRREYLSYEGPVSRSRGGVKRIDAGTFEALRDEEGLWEVRLAGAAVRGLFELQWVGPGADAWELRKLNEAGSAS